MATTISPGVGSGVSVEGTVSRWGVSELRPSETQTVSVGPAEVQLSTDSSSLVTELFAKVTRRCTLQLQPNSSMAPMLFVLDAKDTLTKLVGHPRVLPWQQMAMETEMTDFAPLGLTIPVEPSPADLHPLPLPDRPCFALYEAKAARCRGTSPEDFCDVPLWFPVPPNRPNTSVHQVCSLAPKFGPALVLLRDAKSNKHLVVCLACRKSFLTEQQLNESPCCVIQFPGSASVPLVGSTLSQLLSPISPAVASPTQPPAST